MNPSLVSTTDAPEAVTAALGDLAKTDVTVDESVSEQSDETQLDETEVEQKASDEASDEESEAKNKEQKPKKKGGFQKRIDKLKREREFWKEQALAAQTAKPQTQERQEAKAGPSSTAKPNPNDFETNEAYFEALADWKVEERLAKAKQADKASQLKTEAEKQVEAYREKARDFAKEHDDFDELVSEVDDVPMSLAVQKAILKFGPELTYELAKNREVYEQIARMPYDDAAFELAQIAASFKKAKSEADETNKNKKTSAPPPLKPIGSKSASTIIDPEKMDYQAFKKWRQSGSRK